MFDYDGSPATLWDQYCYDQQNGPVTFLESVWSDTFAPHLSEVIAGLDQTEATLLTFYCCWDEGLDPCDIVGNPPKGIFDDALATAIMSEVARLALDRELPDQEGDEDDDWSEDDD